MDPYHVKSAEEDVARQLAYGSRPVLEEARKNVMDSWKKYANNVADAIVAGSTFLGGAAFIGITLASGNDNNLFKAIIITEVCCLVTNL